MPSSRAACESEPPRPISSSSAILPGPMASSRPRSTRKRTAGMAMLAPPGEDVNAGGAGLKLGRVRRQVAGQPRCLSRYVRANITSRTSAGSRMSHADDSDSARRGRCARPAPLLACALLVSSLGAAGVARAAVVFDRDNAQVEIYGILDIGLGYLEHSYAASDVLASTVNSYNLNSSPRSFTGLYTGGVSMSRFGFRGTFYFGGGQQVFFRLESAINVTTGVLSNNGQAIYNNIYVLHTANSASAINGQAFSRGAYVGFSDPTWGSLELGRTLNFSLEQTVQYDPLGAALLYSPIGYSGGIGGGLGATENSRLDQSVRYENKVGGVSFGAQYKFSGEKSSQSAGYGWVAMLGYSVGGFSIEGTVSEMTNAVAW